MDDTMTAADYRQVIDAPTRRFINQLEAFYTNATTDLDASQQRAVYAAMCNALSHGRAPGITSVDRSLAGVPARHYTKHCASGSGDSDNHAGQAMRPRIIYFHGGGFVVGGLDSHDDICSEVCAATGLDVLALAYRLAPEHRHPAMFDDAVAATRAILEDGNGPVILCGDSAGGNLAAATAHALRHPDIIGQLLIYPSLGPDPGTGSFIIHAEAPLLTRDDLHYYLAVRLDGPDRVQDPQLYPLADRDFSRLPPTVVVTAECDPLRDDGPAYCNAISAAGGRSRWIDAPGLVHGFLRARGTVDRAGRAFRNITDALVMLGDGGWVFKE